MFAPGFTVTNNNQTLHVVLRGEEGAVSYHHTIFPTSGSVYTSMDYHSRRPFYSDQDTYDCNIIGDGSYCDGTTMDDIGNDEEEVKEVLKERYRQHFFERD